MNILSIYEKIQLAMSREEEKKEASRKIKNYPLEFYSSLKIKSLKLVILVIRFFCLLFGDSAENFLIFSKIGKDSVFVCNNSFCQYKRLEKKVRFLSRTAFVLVLISTIITTSVLYFLMPGKPSSKAATSYWTQTSWAGTENATTYANNTSNQNGWTGYAAKGTNVSAAATVTLASIAGAGITETSDTEWIPAAKSATDNTFTTTPGGGTSNTSVESNTVKLSVSSSRPSDDLTGVTALDSGTCAGLSGGSWNSGTSKCDWTPANGATISGNYSNIGTFTVPDTAGYTVNITAGTPLKIHAQTITIGAQATLNGNAAGYAGGAFGAGGGQGGSGSPGIAGTGKSGNTSDGGSYGTAGGAGAGAGGGADNGCGVQVGSGGTGGSSGATTYGTPSGTEIDMGGGGAGGGGGGGVTDNGYDCYPGYSGSNGTAGGKGGGAIYLFASSDINISGTITANGGNGGNGGGGGNNGAVGGAGGGGSGGAGGGIFLNGDVVNMSGVLYANGGNGGSGAGTGGKGGAGRIKIFRNTGAVGGTVTANDAITYSGCNNGTIYCSSATYYSSGTFTSRAIDIGYATNFGKVSWNTTLPSSATTISLKVRTCDDSACDGTGETAWGSITESVSITTTGAGTSTRSLADLFPTSIGTNPKQYIQYQATLSTTNTTQTPVLNEVKIYYESTWSNAVVSATDVKLGFSTRPSAPATTSLTDLSNSTNCTNAAGSLGTGTVSSGKCDLTYTSTGALVMGTHIPNGSIGFYNIGTFAVNTGITITLPAYDGTNGGRFKILASAIDIQGNINGDSKGFRGGEGTGAGGNASTNGGGGGGGYGGNGGTGANSGGSGGSTYDASNDVNMGSGGGTGLGGGDCCEASLGGGSGGAGGGMLYLYATGAITVSGILSMDGAIGGGGSGTSAGGGGGAGGGVLINGDSVTISGTLSAEGGAGGAGGGGCNDCYEPYSFMSDAGSGGEGGSGRIKVYGSTITNTNATYDATGYGTTSYACSNLTGSPCSIGSIYTLGYASSGTFTSQIIDTGQSNASWGNLAWSVAQDTPTGTSMTVKARSCNDSACSGGDDVAFADITAPSDIITLTTDGGTSALSSLSSMAIGDRYVQYQVTLNSNSPTYDATPTFADLTINYNYYSTSQTLTSSAYNTTDDGVVINQIKWTENLATGTNLKFQIRTTNNNDNSTPSDSSDDTPAGANWTSYRGPDGTGDTFFDDSSSGCSKSGNDVTCDFNNAILVGTGGNNHWFQYQATLTSDASQTPTLSSVIVQYIVNLQPQVSNVTASQISDSSSANYGKISITNYDLTDGDSASFDVSALVDFGITLNEELTYGDTTAITITGSNVSALPTSCSPACVIQIENEQISYTSRSGNNLQGTILRGINTTSASAHASTKTIWLKGTASNLSGNVGSAQTTGTGKSILWNIKADYDGMSCIAAGTPACTGRVRVAANDGNAANQVSNETGATASFDIDTKNPVPGANPVLIDASAGLNSVALTISATDDSSLEMKLSNNSDLSADGVNDDSGTWIAYASSKTWKFSTDPDTVYIRFRDSKGNLYPVSGDPAISATSLPSPLNFMIQDTSNTGSSEFREFVAWKVSAIGNFNNYVLEFSNNDEVSYSELTTISTPTGPNLNYYTHPSLTDGQKYYYRIYQSDTLGNKSIRATSICGISNGAQDCNEGGGGTAVQDTPVITENYVKKATVAGQTSLNLSWNAVTLTDLADFDHYEVWYGTNKTDVENKSGTALEWDGDNDAAMGLITTTGTKITGLTASTTYYFKIWASNTNSSATFVPASVAAVSNNTATISFTTDKLSDSAIEYSSSSFTSFTNEQGVPTMIVIGEDHSVTLTGLAENTTYYYRIKTTSSASATAYLPASNATDSVKQLYYFKTTTDTEAPIISGVGYSDLTDSSVVINWTTNEVSTSRVDYGTDTNYDASGSPQTNGNYDMSHSISLTGLSADTDYVYKVTSVDNSTLANSATNDNSGSGYAFRTKKSTDVTPPSITNVAEGTPTYNSVTITWDTTSDPSSSLIEIGTSLDGDNVPIYTITQGNGTELKTTAAASNGHSVTLTGLDPETPYYYQLKSIDSNGNIGYRNKVDMALPDTDTANFYQFTTAVSPDPGDTQGPTITFGTVTKTSTTATITFTTDDDGASGADSLIGYNIDTPDPDLYNYEVGSTDLIADGATHTVELTGLVPNTPYVFRIKSHDAAGNPTTLEDASLYTFTTDAGTDTTKPTITFNPSSQITNITSTSAKISWETNNKESNSLIDFAATDNTFTSTSGNYASFALTHNVTLNNLAPATTYYFRIRSVTSNDIPGVLQKSVTEGFSFTTSSSFDEVAPVISNVTESDPTSNSVTISWDTDEASSSIVEYGTTSTYYGTTRGNKTALVTAHSVALTGLAPNTTYYYKLKSIDQAGNIASSSMTGSAYHSFATDAVDAAGDTQEPTITFVQATGITNITSTSAVIYWTTLEDSDSTVGYSLDTSFSSEEGSGAMTKNHSVTLTNLSPNTTYKIQLKSRDLAGNLATESNGGAGYTFTTLASSNDLAKPIITYNDTTGKSVSGTGVTITWTTDENASSFIDYSKTSGVFTLGSSGSSNLTTAHSVLISNLDATTTYYFRIRSADSNSNEAIDNNSSAGYTFTTGTSTALVCPTVSCGGGGGSSVDTNPPTISDVIVSDTTASSAKVSWKTNENGNSFVEYGETPSYGTTTGHYNNVKNHSVDLTNLTANTTYNYRVLSADSSGNLAQSDNLTFKTLSEEELTPEEKKIEEEKQNDLAEEIQKKIEELIKQGMDEETVRDIISKATQAPAIGAEGPLVSSLTNSSAKVEWTTDRKSNSVIRFKVKEDNIDPDDSTSLKQYGNFTELVTGHSVILSNLLSGTTYQYQAQSSDILGNTGKSEWKEFTTQVTPSIYDVSVSDVTLNSAVINWKTNIVSTSKVEYGKTINYTNNMEDKEVSRVSKHMIKLNNLQSGTVYHYRVRGLDDQGNLLVSDDYTFTTYTLPSIIAYNIEEVSETKIVLKWETNVETDSTIKYTDIAKNVVKKQGEDALSSLHTFSLKGLNSGTDYLLQIQGRDIYGNEVISDEFSVKTLQDTTAPKISQIKTETAVSSGKNDIVQTIVSWKTDEPSTSQIYWEEGISDREDLPNSTPLDENYTTNHIIVITNFKPSSVYRFRIAGKDRSENVSESQDFTILIPERKKSIIQIIINNFESTFGWAKKIGM